MPPAARNRVCAAPPSQGVGCAAHLPGEGGASVTDNSHAEPTFHTGEGLRRLLQRINEAGEQGWKTDPDVPALIEFTIRKYRPLCRTWHRDPTEAATAAFDVLRTTYALTVEDPWAVVTTAVERQIIADAQAERLLIAPDRARKSDITAWETPVRAGEYEEFLFGLAPEIDDTDPESTTAAHIQRVLAQLFEDLGWNRWVVTFATDYVLTRILSAGDAERAHEYLRRDDSMPARLDMPVEQWRAFLRILFDGRITQNGPARRGLVRRIALFDPHGDTTEQIDELLDDGELVLAILDALELR